MALNLVRAEVSMQDYHALRVLDWDSLVGGSLFGLFEQVVFKHACSLNRALKVDGLASGSPLI